MKKWKYTIIAILIFSFISWAEASVFKRRDSDGNYIIDKLEGAGLKREALDLIFNMLDYNAGRIANTQAAVLIDYSKPSTAKRFHLINLWSGEVLSYYVGHAQSSGFVQTRSFSNRPEERKSSLGFLYARGFRKDPKKDVVIPMDGIDKSNSQTREKEFVIYGVPFVSEAFAAKNKRMGWSDGGIALGKNEFVELANTLQRGTLILSYHSDLMALSRKYPKDQSVIGQEILAPGVRKERTPEEINFYKAQSRSSPSQQHSEVF